MEVGSPEIKIAEPNFLSPRIPEYGIKGNVT